MTGIGSGQAEPLSARDRVIVGLLAEGASDERIARRLGVGLRTVQRHIAHIMRTLGASSRFEAGVAAARTGLVGPGGPTRRR